MPGPFGIAIDGDNLTPECSCGWRGRTTTSDPDADQQAGEHVFTNHVEPGEWPATVLRGDGDVARIRERLELPRSR